MLHNVLARMFTTDLHCVQRMTVISKQSSTNFVLDMHFAVMMMNCVVPSSLLTPSLHGRRKASADKALAPIVEESRKAAGLFKGQPPKMSPEVRMLYCSIVLLSA